MFFFLTEKKLEDDALKDDIRKKTMLLVIYRVFIKYCGFSLKFRNFSELCQFCCSAGVLPAWCVYTH